VTFGWTCYSAIFDVTATQWLASGKFCGIAASQMQRCLVRSSRDLINNITIPVHLHGCVCFGLYLSSLHPTFAHGCSRTCAQL
jgi:hypothetical protein